MSTLFISDLHLAPEYPATIQAFLSFLDTYARQADALYILGDFFEVWIGDDDGSPFNQAIVNALKTITHQGVPVYFMAGNRDFLVGQNFLQQTGCRLLTDPTVIDLYGVPTLLMHGDTLCTADVKYLRFRRWVRSPLLQSFFLSFSLKLRRRIADYLRQQSQRSGTDIALMDTASTAVNDAIVKYKVSLLIHGHTHRPSIQYFKLNEQRVSKIVLSDWHEQGNALFCYPNGERRLVTIPNIAGFKV